MVRHGASSPPIEGIPNPLVGGHSNPALAEAGKAQAELVAEGLRHEPISAIFVSTLRRTAETAAPLAAATGLEPVAISELREVFLGDFEGGVYRIRPPKATRRSRRSSRPKPGVGSRTPRPSRRSGRGSPPGSRRWSGRSGRTGAVAVLHGAVMGQLCRQATDSRAFAFVHADNGSVSRLVVNPDGRWLLRSFNDISHIRRS